MSEQLRISLVQMTMEFCQPDKNYLHAEELIRSTAKDADIVVLPELWNTGFFPRENLAELSDPSGRRTKSLMGQLAKELDVNIDAGSVASAVEGRIYNRAYIFDRTGQVVAQYDKTHLFSFMGENRSFTPGDNTTVFELDGIRCGILICYDIRFPELARTIAVEGIDILFVVSQWPRERIQHIQVLSQARAIENQVYLAYVNSSARAGKTGDGGHSALIDPLGVVLTQAGEGEEIVRGTCDLAQLPSIRRSINVFRDRRPMLYHVN